MAFPDPLPEQTHLAHTATRQVQQMTGLADPVYVEAFLQARTVLLSFPAEDNAPSVFRIGSAASIRPHPMFFFFAGALLRPYARAPRSEQNQRDAAKRSHRVEHTGHGPEKDSGSRHIVRDAHRLPHTVAKLR